ncbi:MAG TPA: hypothetical protein VMA53_17505 [Stellaceae bacterium]|nr:hypothetical protein [Stellaceae bacterium]
MSVAARLEEITAAIAEARRAVAAGALVDMSGLDAAIGEICDAARTLPAAERDAFAERLVALAAALDQLALDIVHQREAAQRQRANDAYGQEGPR